MRTRQPANLTMRRDLQLLIAEDRDIVFFEHFHVTILQPTRHETNCARACVW